MKQDALKSGKPGAIVAVALLAGLCLLAAASPGRAEELVHKTLPVGSKVPDLRSTTADGQPFDLAERLAEKSVALFFWSLFCSPCREEMPAIEKLYQEELKDKAVEVVALNLDEPSLHNAVRNFLKSAGFHFTVVLNKTASLDSQSDKLFQVTGTPVLYLIRKDGTICFAHVGRLEPEDLRKAILDNLVTPEM